MGIRGVRDKASSDERFVTHSVSENGLGRLESGGREGIRTPGLLVANEALSQLSYSPTSSKFILAKHQCLANTRSHGANTKFETRDKKCEPARWEILKSK